MAVFSSGKYEQAEAATWAEGDWNGDGRFGTADLIVAWQDGGYEQGPRAAEVPEPTLLGAIGFAALTGLAARKRTADKRRSAGC